MSSKGKKQVSISFRPDFIDEVRKFVEMYPDVCPPSVAKSLEFAWFRFVEDVKYRDGD